jgi:hypothetical protein
MPELEIADSTAPLTFEQWLTHKGYTNPKRIPTRQIAALMSEYQQAGHAALAIASNVLAANELAEAAAAHGQDAEAHAANAIRSAIASGLSLMALRQHAGKGKMGDYMEKAGMAERSGQRYMAIVASLAKSHGLTDEWTASVKSRQVSPALIEATADVMMRTISPNMSNLADLLAITSDTPKGGSGASNGGMSEIDQMRHAANEIWESIDRHFEMVFTNAQYQLLPDEALQSMHDKCATAAAEAARELARRQPGMTIEIDPVPVQTATPKALTTATR